MRTFAALVVLLAVVGSASGQVYFSGPYGPEGSWNLYELRGTQPDPRYYATEGKDAVTWLEAEKATKSLVDPISGKNVPGHLVAFAGSLASQENTFVNNEASKFSLANRWIGLTDSTAFGGSEAFNDGGRGLGGAPGDRKGWKWTDGEVFDTTSFPPNPIDNAGDRDGVYQHSSGFWGVWGSGEAGQAAAPGLPYLVEYDINAVEQFAVPQRAQPAPMSGPRGSWGTFGVREVYSKTAIDFFEDTANALLGTTPSLRTLEYQSTVIDFRDTMGSRKGQEKHDQPFKAVADGLMEPGTIDNLALVAHGKIRIPQGQGGEWTFRVQSDDHFDLWINGKPFSSVVPTNTFDRPQLSPHGSMIYYHNSDLGEGFAHVVLEPGDYDLEFLYGEAQIDASVELTAARGKHAAYGEAFSLIGAPAIDVHGSTPKLLDSAAFKIVTRNEANPDVVDSLAEAAGMIAAPAHNDYAKEFSQPSVVAGQRGYYFTNGYLSPNTAIQASSTLVVDQAGTYTFAIESDDGAQLTIAGATFDSVGGAGAIGDSGQALVADFSEGFTTTWGSVYLEAGQYQLDMLAFAQEGFGYADVLVAPGKISFFDAKAFRLLTNEHQTVDYSRQSGLELVAELAAFGDANGDGAVDLSDFGTLKIHFGAGTRGQEGDFNGDSRVDLSDFGILKTNFGKSSSTAVPEPATGVLVALGAGLCLLVARRRQDRRSQP